MTWRYEYFKEVMLDWFLPELWPFNNFSAVSLVSATTLAVFRGFEWNLPVIVPMTWRGSYYIEVTLDRFLPELWPFVSFSRFINRSSCLRNSSYSFQGILTIVMGSSVRPSVDTSLSPQLLLQFSRDFDETFQLLFPWPENDHILSRLCSIDFYQRYGPLTII